MLIEINSEAVNPDPNESILTINIMLGGGGGSQATLWQQLWFINNVSNPIPIVTAVIFFMQFINPE